ncbi:MAG: ABC-type nitrate/sulfonate/bicarbonate transport system permease component [Polyangiales bacterium]
MWNPYDHPSKNTRRALGFSAVLTILAIWATLSLGGIVEARKLPGIGEVAEAFMQLAWYEGESKLLAATIASVKRVFVAGFLVVVLGVPLGVLMGASPRVNAFLSPLLDPLRSAPVVAILPILVMWLGIGEQMKIAFLFCGAVVFLVPMVRDAMQAVSQQHWIAARDLGATPFEATWHAVLPLAKPRIADAVIVAVSVMWTYITVAEYVNATEGLGQLIQNARRFSAMDQVFVGIGVIVALALVTYALMTAIKKRLYPWETET